MPSMKDAEKSFEDMSETEDLAPEEMGQAFGSFGTEIEQDETSRELADTSYIIRPDTDRIEVPHELGEDSDTHDTALSWETATIPEYVSTDDWSVPSQADKPTWESATIPEYGSADDWAAPSQADDPSWESATAPEDIPEEAWSAPSDDEGWDETAGIESIWPEAAPAESPFETIQDPIADDPAVDTPADQEMEHALSPEAQAKRGLLGGKAKFVVLGIIATVIAIAVGFAIHASNLAKAYEQAGAYYAEGDYAAAAEAFAALGDYEDSAEQYAKAQRWVDAQTKEDAAGEDPDAWDAAAAAYDAIESSEAAASAERCRNMAAYYRGAQKLAEEPSNLDNVKEALAYFENCGGVLDADEQIENCKNLIAYYRGIWRLEHHPNSEKYLKQALKLFKNCDGILDADEQITICENSLSYLSAKKLMDDGQWAKAAAAFADLATAGFRDASALQAECQARADYADAESLFEQGRYYEAYTKFSSLDTASYDGLPDMQERANACVQDMPAGGVLYHNEAYTDDCQLTIDNKGNPNAYYKLYIGDELVIAAFVREDTEQSFMLPSGTYRMNKGYGDKWFGTTDLFGDEGSYYQCTFAGSETFTLDPNYAYIISSGTDGTGIGTQSTSRDSV